MIIVKDAHLADICISLSLNKFWVHGEISGAKINAEFYSAESVRDFIRKAEIMFDGTSLAVFDMSERVYK